MKKFMDEDFLLDTECAKKLYNEHAKEMPIYDYHCHLQPKEIWENKPYENITQVWIYGDHYKWRAMRTMGIDEEFITGGASDYDKFIAYAKTLPYTIGNPLYHWTHLELQRYFDVTETLNEKTAPAIWDAVNAKLNSDGYAPRDFINKSNVKIVCTTDDPIDDLKYHKLLAEDKSFDCKVLPTFRPDKAVEITKGDFREYIQALGDVANVKIETYAQLLFVLRSRIEYFHAVGCRIADHGIANVPYRTSDKDEVDAIFRMALAGRCVNLEDEEKYKTAILTFFASEYAKQGWTMQIHINAIRNNNTKMFNCLGPDKGFDSIHDLPSAQSLSGFLDNLEQCDVLPKVILYSLNPNDNYVLATMMGNFQGGGIEGKLQLGSAWWFNDHKDGMRRQMQELASVGLLSKFVGMLTDSRSFLSYPRHEYFRRIMCSVIGRWIENGEYPADYEILGEIVEGICYNNAQKYFGIDL